jgi:AraC-like DNA-binding protein
VLRPVPVNHYLAAMRALGYRADDVLAGTQIDARMLDDPDYLISHEDHHAFVANIVRLTGDSGTGLDLGLTHDATHFGVLAYTGLSCRTIRSGMEDIWTRYGNAFGVITRLRVVDEDEHTAVVEIIAPHVTDGTYRFAVEEALTVLLKIGGVATGVSVPFTMMEFAFSRPGYGHRYDEIFRCPVSFDAPRTIVGIRRDWLDSPLKTNDPELNRVCREHLSRVLKQAEAASTTILRLRHMMLSRISNLPTLTEAAQEFQMSSRSLARLLRREGSSYRLLAEELRREMAQNWLRTSRLHAKEIGYRLGFQDVAAFRRAFRDWTGKTINEYRVAVGAAAPGKPGAPNSGEADDDDHSHPGCTVRSEIPVQADAVGPWRR